MYDLYRQQEAQHKRNFSASDQQRMEREFRERMKEATKMGPQETMRQYNEHMRKEATEARRRY